MFEQVVMMLIYICLFVAVIFLVLWVLGQIGVPLPAQVIKIMWVIVGLIVLLMLARVFLPGLAAGKLAAIMWPLLGS